MSIVIAYGSVRLELPIGNHTDLSITLPNSFKGGLNIKQEKEHVITLDCSSVITLKEEADIVEVEPVVPPVLVAEPLPSLRIRTPPLPMSPESPVSPAVAYGLSPSPIPYCCPENSPHEIAEPLFLDAPELAPPSSEGMEIAPVNQMAKKGVRQKKDTDITKYVEEGEEITHKVALGDKKFAYCTSSYKMKIDKRTGESYPNFTIHSCNPAPKAFEGVSGYTSLTKICSSYAYCLEKENFRKEGLSGWGNGWTASSVKRNGKMVKLDNLRKQAEETA